MLETLHEIIKDLGGFFVSQGWAKVYGLAKDIQREDGSAVVAVPLEGDNYFDCSICQDKGNYAYIKNIEQFQFSSQKCNSYTVTSTLRIVGIWSPEVSDYSLHDKLLVDLNAYAANNQIKGQNGLVITIQRSSADGMQITLDETNKPQQHRNLALATVDFEMQFIFSTCKITTNKCPATVATITC